MLDLSYLFIIWLTTRICIMTVTIWKITRNLPRFYTSLVTSSSTSCFCILSTNTSNLSIIWESILILRSIKNTINWSLLWHSSYVWVFDFSYIWIMIICLFISCIWKTFSCISSSISSFLTTKLTITIWFYVMHLCRIMRFVVVLTLTIAFHFTYIHLKHVLHFITMIIRFLWSRASSFSSSIHLLFTSSLWKRQISLFSCLIILIEIVIIDTELNLRVKFFIVHLRKTWFKTLCV